MASVEFGRSGLGNGASCWLAPGSTARRPRCGLALLWGRGVPTNVDEVTLLTTCKAEKMQPKRATARMKETEPCRLPEAAGALLPFIEFPARVSTAIAAALGSALYCATNA